MRSTRHFQDPAGLPKKQGGIAIGRPIAAMPAPCGSACLNSSCGEAALLEIDDGFGEAGGVARSEDSNNDPVIGTALAGDSTSTVGQGASAGCRAGIGQGLGTAVGKFVFGAPRSCAKPKDHIPGRIGG